MSDTSHHVLTGKVDITSNLLVGSSHLFVDTNNNRVGLVTTDPHAGLHVNSNAYVNTDLRVGNQIEINATAGRIKAASFEGDGSLLQNTPPGAAATIAVGTTTTGAAGSSASVTNSGTSSAAVFNFTIPKGDQGIQGNPGNPGDPGADGTNYFILSGSNIYRSTGNVGIGNTNPSVAKLHIGPLNGDHLYLASGNNAYGWKLDTDDQSNGAVPFRIKKRTADVDTTVLTIKNQDGFVGIGASVPACALDIAGEDVMIRGNTPSLHFSEGTNGMDGAFRIHYDGANQVNGNNFLAIQHGTNFADTSLHCTRAGNVGVGMTNPLDKFHTDIIRIGNWNGGGNGFRFSMDTNASLRIQYMNGSTVHSNIMSLKYDTGNVGIGVTSADSKLEVRGNIQASHSDTNHGLLLESGGTLRRNYGGYGAGFHFTNAAIWPTDYLGNYSGGGIDFGNSSYRWNNVYTERVDATSTITLGTSASIRQSSSTWTGNPGTDGKLEYHNRTWYAVSGSNSYNIMIFRRDGSDQSFISNEGNLMRTSHSNGYLVGSYNNVGANSTKTNPIYTIGNNYRPNDTSLVDMYGIGYSHGDFTNALRSEEGYGWGLYVAADGDARIGLNGGTGAIKMICEENGDSYAWDPANDGWLRLRGAATGQGNMSNGYTSLAVGNFYAAGALRFSSDDRVKHFEEEIPNALELIQQLKPYKYKKTSEMYDEDYTGDIGEDWEWEIGLIAQDVEKIPYLEHTVSKPESNAEGKYGLNYTQFIGVCIQGIKDLKKELQSEKEKVATMELLVASLVKRVGDLENLVI